MKILVFIICDKAQVVAPWTKTLWTIIGFYLVNKILCFLQVLCGYTANANIQFIGYNTLIYIFRVIEETKIIVRGICRKYVQRDIIFISRNVVGIV